MARSIQAIHEQILKNITHDDRLGEMNSTSKVALFRLMAYVVASAIWVFEKTLQQHKEEVTEALKQKHGSFPWYKQMILNFQYGFLLIGETDQFDNGDATEEEIEASKIITQVSVDVPKDQSGLLIKIAKDREPLSDEEFSGVSHYINEIAIPGTRIEIINQPHDKLLPFIDVFVNPLVVDSNGMHKQRAVNEFESAINNYLDNELEFNGELSVQALIDALQQVDGFEDVKVYRLQTASYNESTSLYGDFIDVDVRYVPESGYFSVSTFENVNYVVQD